MRWFCRYNRRSVAIHIMLRVDLASGFIHSAAHEDEVAYSSDSGITVGKRLHAMI